MKFLILIAVLLLSSCAAWDTVKTTVSVRGAVVADEALQSAIWQVCKGSPVGAILREFNTQEKREAFEVICKEKLPNSAMTASK